MTDDWPYVKREPDEIREDFEKLLSQKEIELKQKNEKMTYIVTNERPNKKEERRFWRENGFLEIHQPQFNYKHTGRVETYQLIKKI